MSVPASVTMTNEDAEIEERLALWANSTHIQGVFHPGIFPQEHDRCSAEVADLIDFVTRGKLRVLIDRVFRLADPTQAHRFTL